MTPLEVASGWITGHEPEADGWEGDMPTEEPVAALEAILLQAMLEGPCLVEFSGGRDSSAVLAVAVSVARRNGLPLPIPITRYFLDAPATSEGDWSELVVKHLDLRDWVKIEIRDELDLLGPIAADRLLANGLLWPVTVHTKAVTFEHARGTTLITGEGGDEIFGPRRITPLAKMLGGAKPWHRGVKPVLAALAPQPLRKTPIAAEIRNKAGRSWLLPEAQEAFIESLKADMVSEPLAWSRSIRTLPRRRAWVVGRNNMSTLASRHGICYLHPLLDPRFVQAAGAKNRFIGYATRKLAMEAVFGELLPAGLLARESKAVFLAAHIREKTRAFIQRWEGTGVDYTIVDARKLAETWKSEKPHAASLALLQQAWLYEAGRL